jgi:hypothetical protein
MKRKKAQPIVEEAVAPIKVEETKPVIKEPEVTHYYRCNVLLENGKPCNCHAFN